MNLDGEIVWGLRFMRNIWIWTGCHWEIRGGEEVASSIPKGVIGLSTPKICLYCLENKERIAFAF